MMPDPRDGDWSAVGYVPEDPPRSPDRPVWPRLTWLLLLVLGAWMVWEVWR